PEARALGTARRALHVERAAPVEDEVQEPAVRLLGPPAESEEPIDPDARDRLVGTLPEIAPKDQRAGDVIDAGHSLFARLARGECRAAIVGVDREPEHRRTGHVEVSGQGHEAVQHGSRLSRISRTSKSAAATTESAAP